MVAILLPRRMFRLSQETGGLKI